MIIQQKNLRFFNNYAYEAVKRLQFSVNDVDSGQLVADHRVL